MQFELLALNALFLAHRVGRDVIVTTISHLCFVLFITFVTFAVATLLFVIVYSYTYTI